MSAGGAAATNRDKLLAFIARCESADDLKELIRKGREQFESEVAAAAFERLIAMAPEDAPDTLEFDFWKMVAAFEQLRSEHNGRTTYLNRTRRKVAKVGEAAILAEWALAKPTEGFRILMEMQRPDLTGEAIILRHPDRFSPDVVTAATRRLSDAGIDIHEMLPPSVRWVGSTDIVKDQ